MKEIVLTQGKVALVDDEDFEWLSQWKWRAHKGGRTFYATRAASTAKMLGDKKSYVAMHRMILNTPEKMETDHRDGNGLHNFRENLRICTHHDNQKGQKKPLNCLSIYKGVSWRKDRNKWRAYIVLNKKQYSLGHFDSEIEAACVYDAKAVELFQEFARLNFP